MKSEFAEELHEVFERFGRIETKRMFGGHGVFHEGRMFGLIAGGRLYLKTDEATRPQFEAKGLKPFEYARKGEMTATSYWEAPAEIYEDREEAARWARLAWEVVLRKNSPPKKKPRAPAKKKTNKPAAKRARP
jgi:DNA transformation protein